MKQRASLLLAVLLLLTALPFAALAEYPADSYYGLGFTEDLDVYTGPGEHYYRAGGNARYGGGGVRYYGSDPANGWMLIGYKTSKGLWRMGYVPESASRLTRARDSYSLFTLSFSYLPYTVTVRSIVTDDPMMDEHTPLCTLEVGANITYLCRWNNGWAYIEAANTTVGAVRGFIRPANIAPGASAAPPPVVTAPPYQPPVVTAPPYQPPVVTARPYQPPVVTASPYQPGVSWETLYYNYLLYMDVPELHDMELVDLDFDGAPELMLRRQASGRGWLYTVLSCYQGAVRASDYFAYGGQNADWALQNGTQSNLHMVKTSATGQRQWLKIGGSATSVSYYGAVCAVTLQNGYVRESVVFTYDVPIPGQGGRMFYTVRGYSAERAEYYTELFAFQTANPRNAYYAPCWQTTSPQTRLTVFQSLAVTYQNVTRYQTFY